MNLSKKRKDRYLEKPDKIQERHRDIVEWLENSNEVLRANTERRLALYKAFQEVVEAVTDICAMHLADTGHVVGDDATNIEKSAGKLFSDDIRDRLQEADGLRNRVVHEYNGLDTELALTSMRDIRKFSTRFQERWKNG